VGARVPNLLECILGVAPPRPVRAQIGTDVARQGTVLVEDVAVQAATLVFALRKAFPDSRVAGGNGALPCLHRARAARVLISDRGEVLRFLDDHPVAAVLTMSGIVATLVSVTG
jgi:hypothetical protein